MAKQEKSAVRQDLQDALSEQTEGFIARKQVKRGKGVITYHLSLDMHRELKKTAAIHNKSMQGLLDEAMDLLFSKYGVGRFMPIETSKSGNPEIQKSGEKE